MSLCGALVGVMLLAGCQGMKSGRGGKGGSSGGSVFLKSSHVPLNAWLDEAFEVEYRKMTLDILFEQQPIVGIRYEFRHIPKESALFSLKSDDISRRDILKRIAKFYHLKMTVAEINGKPAYVLVVGTAATSEFDPNDTGARSVPVLEL
ncbi:MAG: hypothetical protein GXP30_05900 [Verrucomicrobia bacterium]|nr:hypothetical protein [Verrucomicrobiota bacterium]